MGEMTMSDFAKTVCEMSVNQQKEFFNKLKNELSEEDWITTVKFIGLLGLFMNPTKYKAMRTAICEKLFDKEVPFSVKTQFEL